jgi:hypothetical protein
MIVGKGDYEYAVPFMGKKTPMLADLVMAPDSEITSNNYTIVSREKGVVIAWKKSTRTDGVERVFLMQAKPLFDGRGGFIGAVGLVRDITDVTAGVLKSVSSQPVGSSTAEPAPVKKVQAQGGILDWITGKSHLAYKKGVRLYYREGKYEDALKCFDRAVEIDPNNAQVLNDRGLCLKEMGRFEDAEKSFERALELVPRDEEYVYDYGEVLETMGILRREKKIFEKAILAFSKVTDINPNNASAWNHLGVCIKEIGHDEEARQAFERAQGIIRMNKDRMFQRKRETV